jgi:hypothetical protein
LAVVFAGVGGVEAHFQFQVVNDLEKVGEAVAGVAQPGLLGIFLDAVGLLGFFGLLFEH